MKIHQRTIFLLTLIWLFILLAMGGWWLYLMNDLARKLTELGANPPNLVHIIKWEGTSFFVLIFLVTAGLFYYYYRNLQKTKALQSFFAALTHELKTPLASIKLQSEVISEKLKDLGHENYEKLCHRLVSDANSLESKMDKLLHLSIIERGGQLHTHPTKIVPYLNSIIQQNHWDNFLNIDIAKDVHSEQAVLIDPLAFELVLKNLVENSRIHGKAESAQALIKLKSSEIEIVYNDGGQFLGDSSKAGDLFYKSPKSKGSGIGLYLIKRLMKAMNGKYELEFSHQFIQKLKLQTEKGHPSGN